MTAERVVPTQMTSNCKSYESVFNTCETKRRVTGTQANGQRQVNLWSLGVAAKLSLDDFSLLSVPHSHKNCTHQLKQ